MTWRDDGGELRVNHYVLRLHSNGLWGEEQRYFKSDQIAPISVWERMEEERARESYEQYLEIEREAL